MRCFLMLVWLCCVSLVHAEDSPMLRMLIGTYTGPDSKGIYRVDLDPATGKLGAATLVGETANPSFLTIHPSEKFLYATNEVGEFEGKKTGAVTAFSLEPATLKLTPINQTSSGGDGPCFVSVGDGGATLMVANYGGGSIVSMPIAADGSLGEIATLDQHHKSARRASGPHAHSIRPTPDGKHTIACDLGTDQVIVYALPADGTLVIRSVFESKTGAGPRHLAFSKDGKIVFIANELDSTVSVLRWDAGAEKLEAVQTLSTLPDGYSKPNSVAEIVVHPSGKFLYVSNRGHDSIALFAVAEDATLSLVEHTPSGGVKPRNFNVSLDGKFLVVANQGSNRLVAFSIDAATGKLTSTGSTLTLSAPVCIVFLK